MMSEVTETYEHLDPATLVVAENVRIDPRLDRELINSIKARGVLEAINAYRDEDGTVRVLYGQRRTLAAVEAGRTEVPVVVRQGRPDEADRLVDQWVENEHRAALTNSEKVAAVEQMALIGLSEAQIAKRTGTKRATVKAALAASKSEAGTEFADTLTLEQAAALAEFDDDSEAVESLLFAAEDGQFDHAVSRLRNDRAEAGAITELTEQLRSQGKTVVDEEPGYGNDFSRPMRLDRLTDSDDKQPITEAEHVECPGHAYQVRMDHVRTYADADGNALTEEQVDALIEAKQQAENDDDETPSYRSPRWQVLSQLNISEESTRQAVARPVCTEAKRHQARYEYGNGYGSTPKKLAADMTDEEREAAKAERQKVIANNKAWRAAEPVRREWLTTFAARKTPPTGAEAYVAAHILGYHDPRFVGRVDLIGQDSKALQTELGTCTPKRALQIALVSALAEWEASTHGNTWRNPSDVDRRTLRQLGEWGYTLSDVETETIGDDQAADN